MEILPSTQYAGIMEITNVAVIAMPGVAAFELGVLCEAFGTDRTSDGFPGYTFGVVTADGLPVRSASGFDVSPTSDFAAVSRADLVAVPAHPVGSQVPDVVLDGLREAHTRGAQIFSVCSGAFVLGAAGLLDGRRCTTHWRYADELARRHPAARVACDSLYVDDDNVLTSAGTAAGIDAALYLVRKVHGSRVATALARRMVVPPHRDGDQAQFIEAPVPDAGRDCPLEPVMSWMVEHLNEPISVDDLAARSHMAPRTFARRFRSEVGTTPHDWLTRQRVLLARHLLEETDMGIESIAAHAGFGDAATLRHHFTRRLNTTPNGYRARFRAA